MSKTSSTTLLFAFLFLHHAITTISTNVRRDSSTKEQPSQAHVTQDFRPSDHKPTPGLDVAPRFIINPGRPRKALAENPSGFDKTQDFRPDDHKPTPGIDVAPRFMINRGRPQKAFAENPSGFDKAAESDRKPTPERKAPPRFRIQPVKPRNVEHLAKEAFRTQPKRKTPIPPTPEKKAPPQFRIQPVKPRILGHLEKKPIPSQFERKTPVSPAHFHKAMAPTKPRRNLIRRAQTLNPPIPSPAAAAAGGKRWCVAKADASDQVLHANIDYACKKGVDCKPIQKGGDCFNSSSLRSRSSFIMNAFYNINGRKDFYCYFGGSGVLTSTNPSCGKCIYI